MTEDKVNRSLVPVSPVLRNKSNQVSAIQRAEALAGDYVIHLDVNQVKALAAAARESRHGERDRLLIQLIFDGCFRCSEVIPVRPCDILDNEDNQYAVRIMGKGRKSAVVAISPSLAQQLYTYAFRQGIEKNDRFFPITRSQVFRIITRAFDRAGIPRPSREINKVGAVHILRHSGAIERLRQTGNPKAVQHQLRHKSALMTMRYLKTISADESLRIQQQVEFDW